MANPPKDDAVDDVRGEIRRKGCYVHLERRNCLLLAFMWY